MDLTEREIATLAVIVRSDQYGTVRGQRTIELQRLYRDGYITRSAVSNTHEYWEATPKGKQAFRKAIDLTD